MSASKSTNPVPFEVEDEEIRIDGKRPGRAKVIPLKSVLRSLPTTAARAEKTGLQGLDFSMTAEVLAVLGAINLESGLGSEDVPLKDRVDWTLRMAPFLTQLREGFARRKGAKMPQTTAALAEEASKRSASIKRLTEALAKTPAQAGAAAASVVLEDPDDECDHDD